MSEPDRPATHRCPGCHKKGIPRSRLACLRCWHRLPHHIRWVLRSTHGIDRTAHQLAVRMAVMWYREHQLLTRKWGTPQP